MNESRKALLSSVAGILQVQQDLLTDLQFLVEDCMGHEDQQNLPKGKGLS